MTGRELSDQLLQVVEAVRAELARGYRRCSVPTPMADEMAMYRALAFWSELLGLLELAGLFRPGRSVADAWITNVPEGIALPPAGPERRAMKRDGGGEAA